VTTEAIDSLRAQFARTCEETPTGSTATNSWELTENIYHRLHCRTDPDARNYAEIASSYTSLQKAFTSLMPFAVPRTGWTGWTPDGSALRDERGIEVIPPRDIEVTDTAEGPVFAAPIVALSSARRWLQWNSRDPLPKQGYRVYVSAQPTHAYDVWLAIVEELADSAACCAAKVAATPELSRRTDCIVAYSDQEAVPVVIAAIRHAVNGAPVLPDGPGFAVTLAKGIHIGLSDGPLPFHQSLGWVWSERLAKAHQDGDASRADSIFAELDDLRRRMISDTALNQEA
jgi:HopA1 effector protein family